MKYRYCTCNQCYDVIYFVKGNRGYRIRNTEIIDFCSAIELEMGSFPLFTFNQLLNMYPRLGHKLSNLVLQEIIKDIP